ncbi:MAG: LPS export ABC transporter periplasmic protein LptC [Acidobacteria bacterium]|nr:MAG: LPS export ABC transporter periplasmic protein LptC [Acidobacteriota bacterium]
MNARWIHWWPRLIRLIAAGLFVGLIVALVISYRNQYGFIHRAGEVYPEYRMSRHLVSVTENIRHLQTQGDRYLFLMTAARDELYDDGHHELERVSLEVYGDDGQPQGHIRAEHCVYDPSQGLVIFKNRVTATAWDTLSIQTERLVYEQNTGLIHTDQRIRFARKQLSGEAVGAEIHTQSGREQVVLKRHVSVTMEPTPHSGRWPPSEPIHMRCDSAYILKSEATIHLLGRVTLSQANETLTAERMVVLLDEEHRPREISAHGRAMMQSRSPRRTSQVRADALTFHFDEAERLRRAVAEGQAMARLVEAHQVRQMEAPRIEAQFAPTPMATIALSRIIGDHGRVTVRFTPTAPTAPERTDRYALWPGAAGENKTLTADWVELTYRPNHHTLDRAVATGHAVLVLLPPSSTPRADRKVIRAERMEIEFYEDGNLAKVFKAHGDVRVEFEPVDPQSPRPTRITHSQELIAQIDPTTHEFTQLMQSGDFHYVEGERQAKSERAIYDAATHIISLVGGEPVMWDSRGRLRAERIQINLETSESRAIGRVMTTYYTQRATEGTIPFEDAQAPVFIAADHADVKYRLQVALYTGHVRAWQEDSYVTADRLELFGKERMMVATGHVRSGFYRARQRKDGGSAEPRPVFAQAERMSYWDEERLVRYENGAQLRYGSRRLSADRLSVFLKSDENEIERAVAEGHVVVLEPGRRAYGDQAVYTAIDERVVLIGVPARVEDERAQLTHRGPRLTFLLGSDKVISGAHGSSQRVRSVRKIR